LKIVRQIPDSQASPDSYGPEKSGMGEASETFPPKVVAHAPQRSQDPLYEADRVLYEASLRQGQPPHQALLALACD
jgi:hypothetical protein